MAAGLALSVAQTLFSVLQCHTELRELCSMFGYESKLEDLKDTVFLIKAVLLDADSKHQELTETGLNWVEKLKDAVYDSDDLFDELTTKAQQLKNMPGGKLSKKLRRFFSNDNQLLFGFNKSREIKKLRKKLEGIADDRVKFGVSDEYKPVKRREETCSYVYETSIIGREEDKEYIVELLLSNSACANTHKNVSFVSIVGMGGLGKTTLAQLIFNDKRIVDTFGKDALYWVCVSEEFELEQILCKLLDKRNSECTLEALQKQVRQKIEGKRYFLVLDDVWEENHFKWHKLQDILCSGAMGSRILVTTRSNSVAIAVNKDVVYELKGLSNEKSWQLFKEIALGVGDDHDPHLVVIGEDIVKKCANVPLTIKVTSSLLHDLDKSKWEDYRNRDLANMSCDGAENLIMSTLMFSYYNLTPALKSCFSFCSLFPKDYEIEKELLISLWLAQGYLVYEGKRMEDVGADYFWILLQRCFFQDVKRDEYGEVRSCKMHDLMHDLSLKVAGKESLMVTTCSINDQKKKLRHLSATHDAPTEAFYSKCSSSSRALRTLFMLDEYPPMKEIFCINVSKSDSLEKLPRSITKLHNLQILKLCECKALRELPKELGKLVNLRILDIHGCSQLEELPECIVELVNLRILKIKKSNFFSERKIRYMPAGMNKLTNLQTLTYFVVGGDGSTHVQKGELIDLKSLSDLRGHLHIEIGRFPPNNKPIAMIGVDILRKAHLRSLKISCKYGIDEIRGRADQGECHEMLLEGLNPNNDHLTKLVLSGYQGITFPNWGEMNVSFPTRIVRMELTNCVGLKHLSSVSELLCLKYLGLWNMENLEFIERDAPCNVSGTFFPSLEELIVARADKLKGWWRDVTWKVKEVEVGSGFLVDANGNCVEFLPSFTQLLHLKIHECKSLKYFPPCPHLKKLDLFIVDEALSLCVKKNTYYHASQVKGTNPSISSFDMSSIHPTFLLLEELKIDNGAVFNSLFRESFLGCVDLCLRSLCSENEVIEMREGFQRCADSLRHLSIEHYHFQNLSVEGIKYLTNLQSLKIQWCENLESIGDDDDARKLVKLQKGLQYLTSLQIESCYKLEDLGEYVGSLTSLQYLYICNCRKLKSLPKAIRQLTSLTQLEIYVASTELKERCRAPDGEDWPNIRHIPNIYIN